MGTRSTEKKGMISSQEEMGTIHFLVAMGTIR